MAAAHEVYQETVASGITPDFPFFMAYCNVLSQANAHLHIVGLQEKVLRAGLSLENNPAISCSLAKAALEVEAPEMALDIIHVKFIPSASHWFLSSILLTTVPHSCSFLHFLFFFPCNFEVTYSVSPM